MITLRHEITTTNWSHFCSQNFLTLVYFSNWRNVCALRSCKQLNRLLHSFQVSVAIAQNGLHISSGRRSSYIPQRNRALYKQWYPRTSRKYYKEELCCNIKFLKETKLRKFAKWNIILISEDFQSFLILFKSLIVCDVSSSEATL